MSIEEDVSFILGKHHAEFKTSHELKKCVKDLSSLLLQQKDKEIEELPKDIGDFLAQLRYAMDERIREKAQKLIKKYYQKTT